MDSSTVLTIAFAVMITVTPVPSHQANLQKSSGMGATRMEEPKPVAVQSGRAAGDDRMDMGGGGGGWGGGGWGGGWGGEGHFPLPLPGFGSLFGHRQLPFEAISGPYVSSSIGPVFNSGPLGGLGIPFSPGPLGGIMGLPLAMIAMG